MTTGIHIRTVRTNGRILFEGVEFSGKTKTDEIALQSLIRKRVFVQYANYWQTELSAAGHRFAPGCDVIQLKFAD